MELMLEEKDFLACSGSSRFGKEMVKAGPFSNYEEAVSAAREIWFNKVDVNGWLESFATHPQIGSSPSADSKSPAISRWSKEEQSTALATATDSTMQELGEWNTRYRQKFGFVFLICASGRSTPEILSELKMRYLNRPIVEFEIAAQEEMKIIELRLSKLFATKVNSASVVGALNTAADATSKAGEDRVRIIGSHLAAASKDPVAKPSSIPARTRPPITTHVLDVARGSPAAGIEVQLEMWSNSQAPPVFGMADVGNWSFLGSSVTDKDGRGGQLIRMFDALNPGIYRVSFNTGRYYPDGFFPSVSIVFQIRESQQWEHFHVPLLLSPFSFTTYRGS